MKTEERFTRNIPSVSEEEQAALREKKVLIAGCGGLGGFNIEFMARLGVGHLVLVDGDVFAESNLNRQLLSTVEKIGAKKAEAAAERVNSIDPEIRAEAAAEYLTAENAERLLSGCDLAVDALDNVASRLVLEDACEALGIPLVHGAIWSWGYQAAVCMPGRRVLHKLYGGAPVGGKKTPLQVTSLSFTPAACAAVEAAEALKILCSRETSLSGKLLRADMQRMEWETIDLFPGRS